MDDRCEHCRHFEPMHEDNAGQCRRYPPQWINDDEDGPVCMFAIVSDDQVCGEFSRRVM